MAQQLAFSSVLRLRHHAHSALRLDAVEQRRRITSEAASPTAQIHPAATPDAASHPPGAVADSLRYMTRSSAIVDPCIAADRPRVSICRRSAPEV